MFVWVHKENERKEYNGKESKMRESASLQRKGY
jgi:hypothetical protein